MLAGRLSYLCRRCGLEWETEILADLEFEFADALDHNPRSYHCCDDGVMGVSDILAAYPCHVIEK